MSDPRKPPRQRPRPDATRETRKRKGGWWWGKKRDKMSQHDHELLEQLGLCRPRSTQHHREAAATVIKPPHTQTQMCPSIKTHTTVSSQKLHRSFQHSIPNNTHTHNTMMDIHSSSNITTTTNNNNNNNNQTRKRVSFPEDVVSLTVKVPNEYDDCLLRSQLFYSKADIESFRLLAKQEAAFFRMLASMSGPSSFYRSHSDSDRIRQEPRNNKRRRDNNETASINTQTGTSVAVLPPIPEGRRIRRRIVT